MIFNKKMWMLILSLCLIGLIFRLLNIKIYPYNVEEFVFGFICGALFFFAHERMGVLKQKEEYYREFERLFSYFDLRCFIVKDIPKEETNAFIESLERRVQEFKHKLEFRNDK